MRGRVFFIAFQVRVSYSFFFFVSLAAMLSYDTRLLLGIGVGALLLFSTARIRFRDISFVLAFALFLHC